MATYRFTSFMYRLARASADVNAAERGPTALGKRVVRKTIYKREFTETRRIFRGMGLER